MADSNDWNQRIIAEFRANEGRVGGPFQGGTLLLLHTFWRKSGVERVNPVAYHPDGDRYVIIASKGGAPTHPDWYYNLLANPRVPVEVGTDELPELGAEQRGPYRSGRRAALWRMQHEAARRGRTLEDLRRACLEALAHPRGLDAEHESDYLRGYRLGFQAVLKDIRKLELRR